MAGIIAHTSVDLAIMTRTVWGEARGEGAAGWAAVAWVIRNRAEHPGWWGHGIAGICQAPAQFSSWNADDPNRAQLLALSTSDPLFQEIQGVCIEVVNGAMPDPTEGCLYYKVTTEPWPAPWGVEHPADCVIGAQSFYKATWPAADNTIS